MPIKERAWDKAGEWVKTDNEILIGFNILSEPDIWLE